MEGVLKFLPLDKSGLIFFYCRIVFHQSFLSPPPPQQFFCECSLKRAYELPLSNFFVCFVYFFFPAKLKEAHCDNMNDKYSVHEKYNHA